MKKSLDQKKASARKRNGFIAAGILGVTSVTAAANFMGCENTVTEYVDKPYYVDKNNYVFSYDGLTNKTITFKDETGQLTNTHIATIISGLQTVSGTSGYTNLIPDNVDIKVIVDYSTVPPSSSGMFITISDIESNFVTLMKVMLHNESLVTYNNTSKKTQSLASILHPQTGTREQQAKAGWVKAQKRDSRIAQYKAKNSRVYSA